MSGTVTFTPTVTDWGAANRLWLSHHRSRRWTSWLGWAAMGLVFVGRPLDLIVARRSVGSTAADLIPVLFFAAILLGVPLWQRAGIPRYVKRQFSQRPSMADEVSYSWSDAGLHGTTRAGHTDQPWSELYRQLRDESSFVFLMTDQMMLLIPRRTLSDEQAAELAATADRFGPAIAISERSP